MVEKVKAEIIRAKDRLGLEKAFETAPIYLLPIKSDSNEYLLYLLKQIITSLEYEDVLSSKYSAFFTFSLKQCEATIGNTAQLGLYNSYGALKKNLEQWFIDSNLKYQINQGFVLISIQYPKDVMYDYMWWDQFFCQLRRYKNRFLFFVSFPENYLNKMQNYIGKEFFVEAVEITVPSLEDYFVWFYMQLKNYDIQLDQTSKDKLKSILCNHAESITYQILKLWKKYTVWNIITDEYDNSVLTEKYLSEDELIKIIQRNKESKNDAKIGF